jgi:transcriptional regulator with PAS, ATPase and Fis domain
MSLSLQSKLLHILQVGEFSPLGSEKEVRTDAWVIAATNQELEQKVEKKLFRADLYYRLNIIKIYITPLRNRPEDILLLLDYYIKKYSFQFDKKQIPKLEPDHMEKLIAYSWSGNVRELQNVIKRSIVMGNWEEIIDDLYTKSRSDAATSSEETAPGRATIGDVLLDFKSEYSSDRASFSLKKITKKATVRIEKEVISYVLGKTGWNRTNASKILKISYTALLRKINDLKIKPHKE